MANLTKKQKQLFDYIEQFIDQSGYSPTYREIMSGLGYRSVATVAKHIDNLAAIGLIEKSSSGEARSVIIKKNTKYSEEYIKIAVDVLSNEIDKLQSIDRFEDVKILKSAIDIVLNNKNF